MAMRACFGGSEFHGALHCVKEKNEPPKGLTKKACDPHQEIAG
jgi:hypothetical protein